MPKKQAKRAARRSRAKGGRPASPAVTRLRLRQAAVRPVVSDRVLRAAQALADARQVEVRVGEALVEGERALVVQDGRLRALQLLDRQGHVEVNDRVVGPPGAGLLVQRHGVAEAPGL